MNIFNSIFLKVSLLSLILLTIVLLINITQKSNELDALKSKVKLIENKLNKYEKYNIKDTIEIISKILLQEFKRKKLIPDNRNTVQIQLYPFLEYLNTKVIDNYLFKLQEFKVELKIGPSFQFCPCPDNCLVFIDFKLYPDSTSMITCQYGSYYSSITWLRKMRGWEITRSIFHE